MPDSAGTATALFTGVKTGIGMIGMDNRARRGHCERRQESQLSSLADWAASQGKKVGVVTTARITHATPAAVYAHSNDRSDLIGGGRGTGHFASLQITFGKFCILEAAIVRNMREFRVWEMN